MLDAAFIFLLVLLGAYYDLFRKRNVPDIIPAFMWVVLAFSGVGAELAVACFAVVFLLNAVVYTIMDKVMFGWSDILALPPVVVFVGVLPLGLGFIVFLSLYLFWLLGVRVRGKKIDKNKIREYEVPLYFVFLLGILVSSLLGVWYM